MNKAQRRLVVWGAVVFALAMHLSFCRWTVEDSGDNIAAIVPGTVWLSTSDWLGGRGELARTRNQRSRFTPAKKGVAIGFGVLAPLALIGVAGFVHLGGRKPEENTGPASSGKNKGLSLEEAARLEEMRETLRRAAGRGENTGPTSSKPN